MLNNKIVFITGASSGIGAACARYFARAGANLLLCARRLDLLQKLAEELSKEYAVEIHTFKLDVSKRDEVKTAISTLPDKWKNIDILFNNAGMALGLDPLQEGKVSDWEQTIDT